ncbi:HD-GYP domain-containing protein [Thaumasiovibrio subtropicus]|uniref:HD-GYP domain-containing protein n=1 Tax=Thaumasiovibrio subtropicus TaxID=1891207 RepID=UPI000B34EC7C|nr:two-component system response regulator [Thaumasiovibrio subtropicus]
MISVENSTILIVDDSSENLAFLTQGLSDSYQLKAAKSGVAALKIVEKFPIDLVLLDIVMPEMDGYEVIQRLKDHPDHADIPVIFLTGKDSSDDEERGFALGAVDYINKPVSPTLLKARVKTHLQNKISRDILKDQKQYLEEEVKLRTQELTRLQNATVLALCSLAETRDQETGNHIIRTQNYVKMIAKELVKEGKYVDRLTSSYIELLYIAAPLHDIGKVGIPDNILLKPGKLSHDEFDVMKGHTGMGLKALEAAEEHLGDGIGFISVAKEIAACHHEKWDGSGYPEGLQGQQIPLSARLMAVADVYDALISKRIYKDAFPHQKAINIIRDGRGSHFDPDIVDAFLAIETDCRHLAETYKD